MIRTRVTIYSWCCHFNFLQVFHKWLNVWHLYNSSFLWILDIFIQSLLDIFSIFYIFIILFILFALMQKCHYNDNLYYYRKVWGNDDDSKTVTGKYVFERIFPASSIIEYLKTVKSPDKNNHGKSCRIYVSHQNWSILPWNKRIKKAGSCHRGYCPSSG